MSDASPGEFDLIQRFFKARFAEFAANSNSVDLGIGDDCAVLNLPTDHQLVTSVDSLNESVHFPVNAHPAKLARRALATAISDLAAMGASPLGFTLCLSAPQLSESWLQDFSEGLFSAAEAFSIPLIGGDTTRGQQLSLSFQVLGSVAAGQALRRVGAKPGDKIYVSGSLGDARAALDYLQENTADNHFLERYWSPIPRLSLGKSLLGIASSAIDISDGLLADLGHILAASGVGAKLDLAALPMSSALLETYSRGDAERYALTGGDDYELCFTVAPQKEIQLQQSAQQSGVTVTCIGEIDVELGLHGLDKQQLELLESAGYEHF
ncbi:thiamine-phosphate kinase [Spongiibacter sp. KMU-158]|uniref:Thiamine-monophosphate kinase n=1 Tax=Spongiibacter pelagi TaxID=2760804 RepID=A0A927C167_9GAMM|nr:thiamine-phosphate kinase [Spongiibacter pelagi]MBD2857756.1 thiamine-phosphate kinase [Spongiibacter pelagi]